MRYKILPTAAWKRFLPDSSSKGELSSHLFLSSSYKDSSLYFPFLTHHLVPAGPPTDPCPLNLPFVPFLVPLVGHSVFKNEGLPITSLLYCLYIEVISTSYVALPCARPAST